MYRGASLLIGMTLTVAASRSTQAQEIAAQNSTGPRIANSALANSSSQRPMSPPPQAFERKDPLIAGVLSWVLPGVGSYYAGNSHHGTRHVLIEVGGLGLVIVGAARTTTCSGFSSCDNGLGVFAVGYVVLIGNSIWAIVTAVGDANHHNLGQPAKRIAGNFYLHPSIISGFTTAPLPIRGAQRLNIQIARLGL